MKRSTSLLAVTFVATMVAHTFAQPITVANTAAGATNPFLSVVGTGLSIDALNQRIGGACISRVASAANASYVPCGFGLNPTTGFTIQFWINLVTAGAGGTGAGNPDYILGDGTQVSPSGTGAFRCFAGGIAGVGNFVVRGLPSTQALSVGTPLNTANTWKHLALVYSPTAASFTIYVDGVLNVAVGVAAWTNAGTALSVCGFSNSTTPAQAMRYDDLRVYGFPRTAADIAADYTSFATGTGPSGQPNTPDLLYLEFEGSVQPHYVNIATNLEPLATGTRPCTAGTAIEWDADTPAGDLPTSLLINIAGPTLGQPATPAFQNVYGSVVPLPVTYTTPGVPGLELGHGLSSPSTPLGLCWPDGLSLSVAIPGLFAFALAYPYTTASSPSTLFTVPPGVFQNGDTIHVQSITPDIAYPLSIATSNRASFVYNDCGSSLPGPRCHVEARGAGAIQVQGYWEIHNTGSVDITQVKIDATTCVANGGTATGFSPIGNLNTGGSLQAGNSYRRNSQVYTGLTGLPPGFTGLSAQATAGNFGGLQFDFNNFTACTDALVFDCESIPANANGNVFIGATVTVTFAGGAVLSGLMVADPADPLAAVIDL